jgi:hypothetical protein
MHFNFKFCHPLMQGTIQPGPLVVYTDSSGSPNWVRGTVHKTTFSRTSTLPKSLCRQQDVEELNQKYLIHC